MRFGVELEAGEAEAGDGDGGVGGEEDEERDG